MNGLSRKRTGVSLLKKIDRRFGDSTLWQFVKFNLVSFSITLLQLALANLLPLIFDAVTAKLPPVMRRSFGRTHFLRDLCPIRQYRELEERIGNRILHHLQAETAKES